MANLGGDISRAIDSRRRIHADNIRANALRYGPSPTRPTPALPQLPQSITQRDFPEIEPTKTRFWEDPESFFSRAVNFLGTGAFVVGGAIEGYKDVFQGNVKGPKDLISSATKPLKGAARGLQGKPGVWPSEALGDDVTKWMGTPGIAAASQFGLLDNLPEGVKESADTVSRFAGNLGADIILDPFVYPSAVKGVARGVGQAAKTVAPKTTAKISAGASRVKEAAKGKFVPRAKQEVSETLDRAPSILESLSGNSATANRLPEIPASSKLPEISQPRTSEQLAALFTRAPENVSVPNVLPKAADVAAEGTSKFARAMRNLEDGSIVPHSTAELRKTRTVPAYPEIDSLAAPFREVAEAAAPAPRAAKLTEQVLEAATTPRESSRLIKATDEGLADWGRTGGRDLAVDNLAEFEAAGRLKTTPDGFVATGKVSEEVADALTTLSANPASEVFSVVRRIAPNHVPITGLIKQGVLGETTEISSVLRVAADLRKQANNARFAAPQRAALKKSADALEKAVRNTYTKQVQAVNTVQSGLGSGEAKATKTVTRAAETISESTQKDATKRWTRLQGEERSAWLKDLKRIITDEADYKWLRDARTFEQYTKRVGELKSKKSRVPIYEEMLITSEYPPVGVDLGDFKWSGKAPNQRQLNLLERGLNAVNEARLKSPTAQEIIAKYPTGEEAVAARAATRKQTEEALLSSMDEDVVTALQSAIDNQFVRPRTTHKHVTDKHRTSRDSTVFREGTGKQTDAWNSMGQSELWRNLYKNFSDSPAGKSVGWERANRGAEYMLKNMRQAEDFLESKGVWGILSKTEEGLPITLTDIAETLYVHKNGFAKRRIFSNMALPDTPAGHAFLSDIANIYEVILKEIPRNSSPEQVVKEFRKAFSPEKVSKITRDVINNSTEVRGIGTYNPKTRGMDLVDAEDAAVVFDEIVDAVTDTTVITELWQKATARAARYGIELNDQIATISSQTIDDIVDVLSSPRFSQADFLETLARQSELVEANSVAMRESGQNVFEASPIAAEKVVKDGLATKVLDPKEIEIAEGLFEVNKAAEKAVREGIESSTDLTRALNESAQNVHNNVAKEAVEISGTANKGEQIEQALDRGIFRALFPNKSKADGLIGGTLRFADKAIDKAGTTFLAHYNNPTIHGVTTETMTIARGFSIDVGNKVTKTLNTYGNETFVEAFRYLQSGNSTAGVTERVAKAADEIQEVMNMLFDGSVKGGLGTFVRNGIDINGLNARILQATNKADMAFDLTHARLSAKGVDDAAASADDVLSALSNQWKDWDIKDPLRFIDEMRSAVTSAVTDSVIGREAIRLGSEAGMVSKTPKKGWKTITDSKQKSLIAPYMQGHYFHPDFIKEVQKMDKVLNTSLNLKGGMGEFWQKYLDPITASWKVGQTIYNPGHHVRNLVGDVTLTYMAEGINGVGAYSKALKVMAQRGSYDGFDALKALDAMGKGKRYSADLSKGSKEILLKVTVGGKKYNLDADAINTAMRGRGGLLNYKIREDLLETGMSVGAEQLKGVNVVSDALTKISPLKGRGRQAAGTISESRDNFVRIAHWLQVMNNPKYARKHKTLESLMDFATERVRRWHPDGSELSRAEAKYFRRIFPFYSWTRKAIPLVVESALATPGRFNMIPKGNFHFAEMMGMEPESISNQFPTGGLYPSFLKDGMTAPLFMDGSGTEYSMSPGFATTDVLGVLSNPKSEALGMLTPFAKAPFELATGRRIETGTEIDNKPQYIESQIPFVSRFANITGISPLGSLNRAVRGQGLIEPQRAVERGDKEIGINPSNLLSYLTGAGVQKVNTPAYRDIARNEKAKERRREREDMNRGGWFQ